jgi:hypothetical protein
MDVRLGVVGFAAILATGRTSAVGGVIRFGGAGAVKKIHSEY